MKLYMKLGIFSQNLIKTIKFSLEVMLTIKFSIEVTLQVICTFYVT